MLVFIFSQTIKMNGRRRKHIIMFDSRGDGLQEKIEKINDSGVRIEAWFFGGANYERLKDEANYYAGMNPFDIIYIVGGVNELTRKDHHTGKYKFQWKNYHDLEHHMHERLETVKNFLEKEHPATIFIFCPMIGMDLATYLGDNNEKHQEMVNQVTWSFNEAVRDMYKDLHVYVPDFARPVHRQFGEERKNLYYHLRDGLHLNKQALEKWATIARKVADKN